LLVTVTVKLTVNHRPQHRKQLRASRALHRKNTVFTGDFSLTETRPHRPKNFTVTIRIPGHNMAL